MFILNAGISSHKLKKVHKICVAAITKQAKIVRRKSSDGDFFLRARHETSSCKSANFPTSAECLYPYCNTAVRLKWHFRCVKIKLTLRVIFQSALWGLGNWRRSNYSAISREFTDNTRFVFQSLRSRAYMTPTLSSVVRSEGGEKVTNSLDVRVQEGEEIEIHFVTLSLFAH